MSHPINWKCRDLEVPRNALKTEAPLNHILSITLAKAVNGCKNQGLV